MADEVSPGSGERSLGPWVRRIVMFGSLLAIGGPVIAILTALATGFGVLGWQVSLGLLRYMLFAAVAGLAILLIGMVLIAVTRRWALFKWAVPALAAAAAFLFYAGIWVNQMTSVPPIHDVTTDLTNPPEFEALELRADNREIVPDGGRPEFAAVDNAMRWRLWHAEAYGDIQPITVPVSVPAAIAAAEQLVEERGWELASSDPATGRLEATETVSLYRFKDDVVLRIMPNPDGDGSIVHMRSVSRVGISDLGVNADRVRNFLVDLAAATAG